MTQDQSTTSSQEDEEDKYTTKTFEFWIMYNWQTEEIKRYKRKPSQKKRGPYNIVEKIQRKIKMPDKTEYASNKEIEIGKGRMKKITAEEL